MTVNLDKKEFINPHKLGCGFKLWEQLANSPGVGSALIILQAAMPKARGGGDFDLDENWHGSERKFPENNCSPGPMPEDYMVIAKRTIGRWVGDRVVLVGDYAEDSDLPRRQKASKIYERCMSREEWKESIRSFYRQLKTEKDIKNVNRLNETIAYYKNDLWYNLYTDITDDVARVIEHELQGKFEGDGWKTFVYDSEKKD